jgi:colicin import membrane protein
MAMDSTLTRHDNLMPQRTGGMRRGTAMALLVHVGLLIALAFGVSWRSQTPAGVSAELWAAVPQIAAPPAVEPAVLVLTPAPCSAPKVEQALPQPRRPGTDCHREEGAQASRTARATAARTTTAR